MFENTDFLKDNHKNYSSFLKDIENSSIKDLCNTEYILKSKMILNSLNNSLEEYIKTRDTYDKLLNILMDQDYIDFKLTQLGNALVHDNYKMFWSKDNPTAGYCYVLSEVLYHYLDLDLEPYSIDVHNGTHWFLGNKFGYILDLTANQFDYELDYSKAIQKDFYKGTIQTNKGFISERGHNLAKHFKLI